MDTTLSVLLKVLNDLIQSLISFFKKGMGVQKCNTDHNIKYYGVKNFPFGDSLD